MSKYITQPDYIYYKGTSIPKNRFGITDLFELEKVEQKLLLKAYKYFHEKLDESTTFDENYLINLHKKAFSELYEFAGEYRNVNISKGYSTFCQVRFLNQTSAEIFRKLRSDNYLRDYSNYPKEIFARKIAYYMCELIALHPFFEINGRIIRLFFDMIAIYNGYNYIDYSNALKLVGNENKFIKASIECMLANDCEMYSIILDGLKKA